MATSIGARMPPPLVELLDGEGPAGLGTIVQLVSVDPRGFPHVALLSAGEMARVGKLRIRVALRAEGGAVANLAERPQATLVLVEPAGCAYVLVRAAVRERRLAPAPTRPFTAAVVELTVEETRLDEEAGAAVVSGPRYARALEPAEELAAWRETREALCSA